MKLTLDDLTPGETYVAWNQGMTITPYGVEIIPLSIDAANRFIRYRRAGRAGYSETSIERFLEILNAPPRPQGQNIIRFNPKKENP